MIDKTSKLGESFALGAMPTTNQPSANARFPELFAACIALEATCLPHRPPSSTVVINKHAQFKPHKDSGAGAGQSTSMIVGLGDYTGGELVVEGEPNNIRYTPLEFDGWQQLHWTLPFHGERFSVVWFTPNGCEQMVPTPTEIASAVGQTAAWKEEVSTAKAFDGGAASSSSAGGPSVQLRVDCNGKAVTMPSLGLGTFGLRSFELMASLKAALASGYRLVDTAASYKNEEEIGAILREEVSLRGAAGVRRDQVFLTSKLRPQVRLDPAANKALF